MAEKETFYFSHDYNARNDPRLIRLSAKHGMAGLGIYWCIIEMLYEQGGYLPLIDIESIAYDLHSECERITNVLQKFDLFKFSEDKFYSESVLNRLERRKDRSNKARESANYRWNDANAMRTHSERYANKGKESKIKEKNKRKFTPPTPEEVKAYFKEKGYSESSAINAFEYYNVSDWHDRNGKAVRNWKQKMCSVWFKRENKEKPKQPIKDFTKQI